MSHCSPHASRLAGYTQLEWGVNGADVLLVPAFWSNLYCGYQANGSSHNIACLIGHNPPLSVSKRQELQLITSSLERVHSGAVL